MAEIRWTKEAHRWLRDIYDYIAADNSGAAQNVVSGIYEKAQVLRDFPQIGYRYRADPELIHNRDFELQFELTIGN